MINKNDITYFIFDYIDMTFDLIKICNEKNINMLCDTVFDEKTLHLLANITNLMGYRR